MNAVTRPTKLEHHANNSAIHEVLDSFEADGWRLQSDCGPCANFVHQDGRTTRTFYPSDLSVGWPRYVVPEYFDAVLLAVATLAHLDKPRADPPEAPPYWYWLTEYLGLEEGEGPSETRTFDPSKARWILAGLRPGWDGCVVSTATKVS